MNKWTKQYGKEDKRCPYLDELHHKMISERISKVVKVRAKIELSPSDPCRLSATIATIPPPPTEDISHASRFKTI